MKSLLLLPFLPLLFALPTSPVVAPAPRGEHDWTVDSGHSSVVFRIKHMNAAWFQGTFDVVTGNITLDAKAPEAGSVVRKIPVDSVDSNDKKRDDHLKGPDFFNGKENPEITFKSTKIAAAGKSLKVTGDLSLAGKTRSVTIDVEHIGDAQKFGTRRGYSTKFAIKRSDFGMTYGIDEDTLGDEVTLLVDLELLKAEAKK